MSQFKAGFLARTSHELRSPLNSVISLHQLILADLADSPEEERDFINQAHTAAQKMLKLLDELIRVSKTEYGTEQFQLQPLQLAMMLEEVERLTHLQAQNRSLRLEVELPNPNVYVSSDPRWLHQILLSLIDTPLSLMQEGTVRVTTQISSKGDRALIQIEDERPPHHWSEPIHLLQSQRSPSLPLTELKEAIVAANNHPGPVKFSPEFMLLINQTLLELMGGHLELVSIPVTGSTQEIGVTCIQCSIPLVMQENL
ncbi:sensor histidine kinase [Oscillatoria sp. FACHB-1407]|uniref:sensor histidine kinase n=1 Tax=Oscillatoria sp. FACHB-1407 TaxID=2692847 RepID=UPI001F554904|nr:HAMP domain-containing sensor histidine kinase [Oscillatoria sp. FACHB-1407]